MEKSEIKHKLRESLAHLVQEKEEGGEEGKKKTSKKKTSSEYAEIEHALDKNKVGAPNQADIMQLAGLGDVGDKTKESLFGKKLKRKKNKETGSTYMFDDQERAAVLKAINTAKK